MNRLSGLDGFGNVWIKAEPEVRHQPMSEEEEPETNMRTILEEFADGTTVHGVPKIIKSRSNLARLFWVIVCVTASAMFVTQMAEVLRRYFSYQKKVTVEVVAEPVPFPSISICNMRNLDTHILNSINSAFIKDHLPINHINTTDQPFVREYMKIIAKYAPLWYSDEYQSKYPLIFKELFSRTSFSANIDHDVLIGAGTKLGEFVVSCIHSGNTCDFDKSFKQFFDPYYYNCYRYTPQEGSVAKTIFSFSEGIENGWSTIVLTGNGMLDANQDLRVMPGLHESHSAVSASEGVRVVIHPPGTEPFPLTEGYDVPTGFSASFGIRPRRNLRIGQPWGNCSHSNPLTNTSGVYRGIACQKMCLQMHVIQTCGCYDISLPRIPGAEAAAPCRENREFPEHCMHAASPDCLRQVIRLDARIQCARRTRDLVVKGSTILDACHCHPPCDEIYYDVSYSLSKWPAAGYEGDAAYYDIFYLSNFKERFIENAEKFKSVDSYFLDAKREQTMKDFARLNVYVADSSVMQTEESPDYGEIQLLSDIGGQLGLWVGISVITLAEVMQMIVQMVRYACASSRRVKAAQERKELALNSHIARNGTTV